MVGFRQSEMDVIAPGVRHRRDAHQSVTVIDTSRLGAIYAEPTRSVWPRAIPGIETQLGA
jgi:hypothetical protein